MPEPDRAETPPRGTERSQRERGDRVVPQPTVPPSAPPNGKGRPPAEAVALAMTNGSSTPRLPVATTGRDARGVTFDPAAPVRTAAPEPGYEESLRIRAVLLRYESACNRLDAKAAGAVWPGVDQSALSRAFDELLSQKVSLGICDITVNGDSGEASCAGKARWAPKTGSGVQTADRRWDFDLRKTGEGWKIQEIRVR